MNNRRGVNDKVMNGLEKTEEEFIIFQFYKSKIRGQSMNLK